MILIKFGKNEHLELLKKYGIVHFSQLETYQNDPTSFRGDRMEGKEYIDPSKPLIINGHDISQYFLEATASYLHEDPPLSFSASMLSYRNCHQISGDLFALNEDFIEEMKQFGDSFLVLNAYDFIGALEQEFKRTLCSYEFDKVVYIDKHDYSSIRRHYSNLPESHKQTRHLFVKDTVNGYPLQNEWRAVVFDHGNHYVLKDGGKNIPTSFRTQMPVFPVDQLKTFQCSEEFLFK